MGHKSSIILCQNSMTKSVKSGVANRELRLSMRALKGFKRGISTFRITSHNIDRAIRPTHLRRHSMVNHIVVELGTDRNWLPTVTQTNSDVPRPVNVQNRRENGKPCTEEKTENPAVSTNLDCRFTQSICLTALGTGIQLCGKGLDSVLA